MCGRVLQGYEQSTGAAKQGHIVLRDPSCVAECVARGPGNGITELGRIRSGCSPVKGRQELESLATAWYAYVVGLMSSILYRDTE